MFQELRYASRAIRADLALSGIAVLTLALGIGANTALFTVAYAVLVRPLPFHHADRLVRITGDFTGQSAKDIGLSIPELLDYQERSGVFDALSGVWPISANLTGSDEPERIEAALVDANYFALLGVTAQIGRVFGPADAQPGIGEGAVISDAIWRRRFGADPNVIGRRIRIDNDLYTILGVMPSHFRHPGRSTASDISIWSSCGWLASPFSPEPVRRAYLLQGGIGRLKSGLSIAAAQARLDVFARELRRQFPQDYPSAAAWAPRLIPLQDDLVGHLRPALLTLLAAVAIVLLAACANTANLLLARSTVRQRDSAIRRALGAGRARIIGQSFIESVLVAALAGVMGLLFAFWGVSALSKLIPPTLPPIDPIRINVAMIAFAIAVSVATAVLCGLAPVVQGWRTDLQVVLRESAVAVSSGRAASRLRATFVMMQFALAFVLLASAALLGQSFWRLERVHLGFDPTSVLTARLWLPQPNIPESGAYFTHEARATFYRRVMEAVGTIPGVRSVAGVGILPLSGSRAPQSFSIEGRRVVEGDTLAAQATAVTPGYFETLRIPVVRGRVFSAFDTDQAAGAAVVSESFARKFFPGEEAIGKRVLPGRRLVAAASPGPANWLTVVGVVGDIRTEGLEVDPAPVLYRAVYQASPLNLALVVRTSGDPARFAEGLTRQIRGVDPNQPIYSVRTMVDLVSATLAERRFTMQLLAVFAAIALALSGVGIYGVMSYYVGQRRREIGIRMALGASRKSVLWLVLGRATHVAVTGVVLGLGVSLIMMRTVTTLLFGIGARDPVTYLALAVVLWATALLATYLPARRATACNPAVTLRLD